MSGIYIPGVEMPKGLGKTITIYPNGMVRVWVNNQGSGELLGQRAVSVPPHGRLIDTDALRAKMYHEAFETDTPMQKWDSGCWIRYKMFERMEEAAPTIIPADKEGA